MAEYILSSSGFDLVLKAFLNAGSINIVDAGGYFTGTEVETALQEIGAGTAVDHGTIQGLGDDDHTQYIKHSLATAVNDFLVASGVGTFVKKTLAETGAILEADLDHGNIQGLADDDHAAYPLVTNFEADRATLVTNWTDLTDAGATTLHKHDHGGQDGLGDNDHTQYILHSLADAENDFLVASGADTFIKKTLAETGAILEADINHDNLVGFDAGEHFTVASIDHGSIAGLGDDDHTQYIKHSLVTAANDFLIASGIGTVVKKTLAETGAILEADINHDNLVGFDAGEHFTVASIDHGSIAGLADDDHPAYPLVTNFEADRATLVTNWTDLTDGGATALHSHAGAAGGIEPSYYKHNLKIVPGTTTATQVTITADELTVTDGSGNVKLLSTVSEADITISASGAAGLDTGSEATSTMYYIWIIHNSSSSAVAGMFSLSASAPTMPAGYDYKRLVGEVYNNSSGNFVLVRRYDDTVYFDQQQNMFNDITVTSTWTSVNLPAAVPSGTTEVLFMGGNADNTSLAFHLSVVNSNSGYQWRVLVNYLTTSTWGYYVGRSPGVTQPSYVWVETNGGTSIYQRSAHGNNNYAGQICDAMGYRLTR
jgi:hypothetical protein